MKNFENHYSSKIVNQKFYNTCMPFQNHDLSDYDTYEDRWKTPLKTLEVGKVYYWKKEVKKLELMIDIKTLKGGYIQTTYYCFKSKKIENDTFDLYFLLQRYREL